MLAVGQTAGRINVTYHPLRTQSAFHQVSDSDGANEG